MTRTQGSGGGPASFFWDGEYPLVRWLEANGYDVSYASGVDTDRRGPAPLQQHRVFLSSGHDEYWSGAQRANVEAARDPESTWRSSAAIKCSGRRAGKTAPTRAARLIGPWSATRRHTRARRSIQPTRRRGPAPGAIGASVRRLTAAGPKTASPGICSWSTPRAPTPSPWRPHSVACVSGATPAQRIYQPAAHCRWPPARWVTSGTSTWTTATGRRA